MSTKDTPEIKQEADLKAPPAVRADGAGLDHNGGDQALHSVKRIMDRLFGTVRGTTHKKR